MVCETKDRASGRASRNHAIQRSNSVQRGDTVERGETIPFVRRREIAPEAIGENDSLAQGGPAKSEMDLVARLRAGDAEAVGPYIELHRRGLLSHIERNLGAGVRAKGEPGDVLQEVSLTAFTALPRYDLQDRHPLNWLYQIAHRRIVGAYRRYCSSQKRASHREAPLYTATGRSAIEWLADHGCSPEHSLMRRELLEQVGRLWERLTDDQRATLRMRYVEGKPFKEIGDKLGKSDCAVRVLLCRTLDRLQILLDAKE